MKEIEKSISFLSKDSLEELKALIEKQDTRIWELATDLEIALDLMKMLLEQDVITPDLKKVAMEFVEKSKAQLKSDLKENEKNENDR